MRDAILFDMDGTLVDWAKPNAISWNETFRRYGWWERELTGEDFRNIAGHTTAEIGKMCFPNIPEEESYRRIAIASAEEVPNLLINAKWEHCYLPNKEFLPELAKKYKIFIISNCMAGYIDAFFTLYGGREAVIDYRDNRDGISKPENIRQIVAQYGLKNPLYVGDTVMDQKAAQEAGVSFLFASYGYGKVEGAPRLEKLADLLHFEN
ncbi:MAG: HAD family hydrolase [Bacilli bacterium]|nr:HAD family hydrolase [Bacilli bacterium]